MSASDQAILIVSTLFIWSLVFLAILPPYMRRSTGSRRKPPPPEAPLPLRLRRAAVRQPSNIEALTPSPLPHLTITGQTLEEWSQDLENLLDDVTLSFDGRLGKIWLELLEESLHIQPCIKDSLC
jgi:hypothetical protein